MPDEFRLPPVVANLVSARNDLSSHYRRVLEANSSTAVLNFTFDGNLVGDIGEALAVELFGIRLVEGKSFEGIDGYGPDGRTVQVKATVTGRGPAFRATGIHAEHLIFFDLDLDMLMGAVVYNGPEHTVRSFLPEGFRGQRMVSRKKVRDAGFDVPQHERLPFLRPLLR